MAYTYSPLEFSDSIRLLLLQPASNRNESLRGRLVTRTLSSIQDDLQIRYNALSYVWGDPVSKHNLELIEETEYRTFQLGLTTNLHGALTDIRDASREIWIWADAVCIDQDNLAERGHQVGLMGDIYCSAGCTIIYLGPSSPDIEYAFHAIQSQFQTSTKRQTSIPENTAQEADLDVEILNNAIHAICSRDWFNRGWVFQELVLSRNPRVQCGQHRVGWDHLRTLIQKFQRGDTSASHFHNMDKPRNDHAARTFFQLVTLRKGTKLSDPRDFFFCLMGIASDAKAVQERLPIDYSLAVRDVFVRATGYMIDTVGLTSVLKYVDSKTPNCGLPSYVPTWGILELPTTSTRKDPLQAECRLSERGVAEDRQDFFIDRAILIRITALGAIIPQHKAFVDAYCQSLQLLADRAEPDEGSPLEGLWQYLAKSENGSDLWCRFGVAMSGIHSEAWTIDPIDLERFTDPCTFDSKIEEGALQAISSMIRLVEQNLSLSGHQNNSVPEHRLAMSDGLLAIVPADTVNGDLLAGLGRPHHRKTDPKYTWFVFRPVEPGSLGKSDLRAHESSGLPIAVVSRGVALPWLYNLRWASRMAPRRRILLI